MTCHCSLHLLCIAVFCYLSCLLHWWRLKCDGSTTKMFHVVSPMLFCCWVFSLMLNLSISSVQVKSETWHLAPQESAVGLSISEKTHWVLSLPPADRRALNEAATSWLIYVLTVKQWGNVLKCVFNFTQFMFIFLKINFINHKWDIIAYTGETMFGLVKQTLQQIWVVQWNWNLLDKKQ